MPLYNITQLQTNMSSGGLTGYVTWINEATGGWFLLGMSIIIYIVILGGAISQKNDFLESSISATFVILILSIVAVLKGVSESLTLPLTLGVLLSIQIGFLAWEKYK